MVRGGQEVACDAEVSPALALYALIDTAMRTHTHTKHSALFTL